MLANLFSRRFRGQVALEALLSIVLLLAFFFIMWAVGVAIHNQSRMQTATQLAAQGALLAYDRNSYRGVDVNGSTAAAKERATDIAGRVFVANACGMIAAPFVQEVPVDCSDELPSGPRFVSVACADELNDASFSEAKCGTDQGSKATRVTVNAEALQPLWLVSADPSESGALSYRLTGRASAYSYSPSAEAEEE